MEQAIYEMKTGTLNDIYDQIINCRVVKPPQEKKGMYNSEFFLDKRLGLSYIYKNVAFDFLDERKIGQYTYYLYEDGTNAKIGVLNGSTLEEVSPSWLTIDATQKVSLATGRGPVGNILTTGTLAVSSTYNQASGEDILEVDAYTGGYVKITLPSVTNVTIGKYITFTSGGMKGVTNKIYNLVGNDIWIIGTTARGTIPLQGDEYLITANVGTVLLVGHSLGVDMLMPNGLTDMGAIRVLATASPVVDLCNYDGNLFALLQFKLFFSRSTFDGNINFHPLDNFNIDNGKSLFPIGKSLLVFADTNKLFAAASTTSNSIGYVGYDINYSAKPFSDHSFIFTDNMIQVVQDDLQLMKIDLIQSNNTAFDISATNMMNNRGLFEEVNGGKVTAYRHDRFHSYVWVKDGKSKIFEFDKQYQHWLINTYDCIIERITEDHIITEHGIAIRSGYLDDTVEYKQEINFSLSSQTLLLYMPWVIRTIFGLIEEKIDLALDIEIEIGGRTDKKNFAVRNYTVDDRLSTESAIDDLLEEQLPEKYTGSIFSIQNSIYKTGRYFRFSYNGFKRFCMGPSLTMYNQFRPFINEPIGNK